MQDFCEEVFCAVRFRIIEESVFRRVFDNFTLVHKDHPIRHFTGKAHFVGE